MRTLISLAVRRCPESGCGEQRRTVHPNPSVGSDTQRTEAGGAVGELSVLHYIAHGNFEVAVGGEKVPVNPRRSTMLQKGLAVTFPTVFFLWTMDLTAGAAGLAGVILFIGHPALSSRTPVAVPSASVKIPPSRNFSARVWKPSFILQGKAA